MIILINFHIVEPPQDMVEKELESVEGLNHEQVTTIIRYATCADTDTECCHKYHIVIQ